MSSCNGWAVHPSLDADVAFNTSYDFTTVAEGNCSGEIFLESVLTHEIGHVLGLGHSTDPDAVMAPSVSYCFNPN